MVKRGKVSKRKCYHEKKHENIWREKIKINSCDDDGEEADGNVNDNDDDDDDDDDDDNDDDDDDNTGDSDNNGDDDVVVVMMMVKMMVTVMVMIMVMMMLVVVVVMMMMVWRDDGKWLIALFAYYFVNRFIIQGRIHGGTTIRHEVRDWFIRQPPVNKKENLIPGNHF